MPIVKMELLQANGRLRKAKASTETQWPNFLVNHHDRHAYSLNERPVSYDVKPVPFYDWDSLIAAEPPLPPHMPDKLLCVCEDGAIWPISNEIQPDLNDRQMLFKEFFDDGAQSANAQATKDAQGSSVITAASIICMMVFAAASLILVVILLQSEFGDSFTNFASIHGIFSGIIPLQIANLAGWGGAMTGGNLGLSLTALGAVATEATSKRRRLFGRKPGQMRQSRTPKAPKEKKLQRPKMIQGETLRLFDELAGFFWSAELPMSILMANLPTNCRYSEEPKMYRYMGAAIFGLAAMVLIRIPLIFIGMGSMTGLALALVLGLPLGALIGYMKGYKLFQPAPRWIARRLYVRDEEGRIDYEALPVIIPEAHTLLAGIPAEEAYNVRRETALSALAQFQESRRQAVTPGASGNGNGNGPEPEEQGVQSMAMAYSPRVLRASTLYQILKCVDLREKLKGPEGKGAKVQQIAMAGMAIGSIGLLVFAIVVTQ